MPLDVAIGGIIGFVVAFVCYFTGMVVYTVWKKKHPKKQKAEEEENEIQED